MQNLMDLCKATLSEQAATCVFTFTYDRMKRYQGEWHLERSYSFPDYFFIESSNGEQLEKEMNRNELASKILATGGIVTPVDRKRICCVVCQTILTIWECPPDISQKEKHM